MSDVPEGYFQSSVRPIPDENVWIPPQTSPYADGYSAPRRHRSDDRLWIWTDGSFHTDSSVGGWAWCLRDGTHRSGPLGEGISSEYMELYAIRQALEAFQRPDPAHPGGLLIFSDHQGLVHKLNAPTKTFRSWAANSRRHPEIAVLLVGVDLLLQDVPVEFRWTKGHHRDAHNKIVDRLSRRERVAYEANPDPTRGRTNLHILNSRRSA